MRFLCICAMCPAILAAQHPDFIGEWGLRSEAAQIHKDLDSEQLCDRYEATGSADSTGGRFRCSASRIPFHFRSTSSARFNTSASASSSGHRSITVWMLRLPASNTDLGLGLKWPPVE